LQIKIRLTDHPEDVESPAPESDEEVRSLDFVNFENQDSVPCNSSESIIASNVKKNMYNNESSGNEICQETKTFEGNHDSKVTTDKVKT
jgi:hypothetical protein